MEVHFKNLSDFYNRYYDTGLINTIISKKPARVDVVNKIKVERQPQVAEAMLICMFANLLQVTLIINKPFGFLELPFLEA